MGNNSDFTNVKISVRQLMGLLQRNTVVIEQVIVSNKNNISKEDEEYLRNEAYMIGTSIKDVEARQTLIEVLHNNSGEDPKQYG